MIGFGNLGLMITSTKRKALMKSLTAAAAVPALMFGVAACSDADQQAAKDTASNATEKVGDAASSATEKAGEAANSATASNNDDDVDDQDDQDDQEKRGSSDGTPKILLNGKPVKGDFSPAYCKTEKDDGQDQLKFEAGKDQDNADELEVEITQGNPLMLTGFSLKTNGTEYETSDQEERDAKVIKTGDQYSLTTKVHEDDNNQNTADVKVTFNCKV